MTEFQALSKPLSKYEISANGIIRNIKKKTLVSKEKGGKTVRLIDDKGNRATHHVEELLKQFKKKEPKTLQDKIAKVQGNPVLKSQPKEKKDPGVKREKKHIDNPKDPNLLKQDARIVMLSEEKNYTKVMKLHDLGYSKEEIIEITGKRPDVISKYLRPFYKKDAAK